MIITTSTKKKKKEEDIAPVKETTQEPVKKNKVVKKSSHFDDGYDFGDVTKTILSTTGDLFANVGKGFMNTVEGVVDTARTGFGDLTKKSADIQADIWDFLGNKSYASGLRNAGQDVKDLTYRNAQMDVTGALLGENKLLFKDNWSKKLNEGSVAGTMVNSVEQGIGNIGAFVGLAGIGGLGAEALGLEGASAQALTSLTSSNASTFLNSFSSAYGNSLTNGLRNGETEKEAKGQAITSGLAEAISEQFFQGIPGLKSAGWGDKFISKPVEKYLKGKTGKIALKIFDGVGEGLEEVISNVLQATFEGIRNEKNVKDIFNDAKEQGFFHSEETREAFISALISSALTNGGSALITNQQKNSIIKSYAEEHDMSVEETKNLFDSIVEKKANLEDTSNYKERVDLEENIGRNLAKEMKGNVDLNELFKTTPSSKQEMQFRFSQDEANNVKSDKQNVLANDMQRINDVEENHKLYKIVNAIQSANDTQQYHITTTEGLYEMGIVDKNDKGEYVMPDGSPYVPRGLNYKNGEIYINADVGSQSGTQAVYHEMLEGFKKASPESYNEFKQMVTDIIGEENIQKEFDTYKTMYGEELTNDIRDEIINDKFGELAENENFINKIADNRNVLEKFIDSVKNMIKYVKGTDEERQLMKLQKNLEKEFAKRYKETDFSQGEGDTAYSLGKHYGDLGKGNDTYYTNMSGDRNTGHFGTGTYFVNEEYQPGETSSYANRPVNKVEFDNYNLYKPRTENEGFNLHDGLKAINSKVLFEKDTIDNFRKGLNKYNDELSQESIDNLMNLLEQNDYQVDDIKRLFEERNDTQAEKRLIDRVEDIIDDYDRQYRNYRNMVMDIRDTNTNLSAEDIYNAFEKTRATLNEYNKEGYKYGQYPTAEVDSLSTIFMKELGYNGIDVRDFDGLDNTTYGSVIYDLDNQKTTDTKYSLTSSLENNGINTAKNINDDFFKEHGTDFDKNNGKSNILYDNYGNRIRQTTNVYKLEKGDNLAKLSTTLEQNVEDNYGDLYIEELYVKNKSQGLGTEIVNSLKQYAKENNLKLHTIKELGNPRTQKFWNSVTEQDFGLDRSARELYSPYGSNYNISRVDSNGKKLSYNQREYFKDSKVVDENRNLLEVYRGEPTIGKTTYESRKGGGNKENNEYGIYFTNSKDFAKDFAFERIEDPNDIFFVKKGKEGEVKSAYLNIINPLDLGTITEEEIRSLYPYASSMAKQITDEEKFVSDMLDWQQIGNHQLMKSYLDMKEVADNTDYDGLIAKLNVQGDELEYAVFNSNQIKSTDNLNPTENDDIRLSLTSNENIDSKEIAPVGSTVEETIAPIREDISNLTEKIDNLSTQLETMQNGAEMTSSNEIAPVRPTYQEMQRANALNNTEIAPEEAYKDENYWKTIDEIGEEGKLDSKLAKKLSKNMASELGLKKKQLDAMQNVINKAWDNGMSLDQIKQELWEEFGHGTVVQKNEEAIDAQREIRKHPINVPDSIKSDIADYGYWKQNYFGKIKFSKDGLSVDKTYQELNEYNPGLFPSDITNPTDQLLRIAEVADLEKKYSVDYEMSLQDMDAAANYIHDTFVETMYNNAMKQQTDLEEQALQYNERTKDIPYKKKTRAEVREFLQNGMGITTEDLQAGNDIKALSYQITTPERVNEKVFGREVGKKINEQTVNFAKHQEAERIRFLAKERQEIADLGIKARSKESALVQQYGEGKLDDVQLAQQVEDKATQDKIKNAAKVLRQKYDDYLDMINEELVDMGYDPIPKRKDYMRHFQELTDKFSMVGIPFNRQDLNENNLPTDINGLTEFNVPGKNWFASALKRTGDKTTFDAITGIDGYLEGASNLMYHTETIQRYRALEKLIRDTYGQTHGMDVFGDDISSEQAMQRLQDIENGKLSNYVAWLKEQGNAIAGKKTALDRAPERLFGRKGYSFFNTLKKSTGSNMTGLNVRSALTNFISSTIAASKTNKMAMAHGTIDTIKNMFHDDGFINKSDFLTSRLRSDTSLSKKTWQKIANAGQIFMSGSDWFTSNLIVRSKYYEGLSKGMTDEQAIKYADDFGARVMGDRSKGATAEAFNSKTLGFLTQFQLETNNQWQYMIHDTKMEFQENLAKEGGLKAGATLVFQMGQLAAYSYLFNEMFEKLTGSRAAFDPVDIFKKLFAPDDDDKDKDFETRMKEAGKELADALPFTSLFGSGGRLPIGEMLTPAATLYDYITGGTNKYGQEITLKNVKDEALSSLPYYVLPTGYGQIKKTAQGLGMYDKDNPVPGSYTDSGNLRYTADTDTASIIKNALFGQWSGEEARKYRESGYKTIRANDIQEMQDLGMKSSEYREYKENLKEAGTKNADKLDYINSLNIPINEKNIMASNVLDRNVDMSNYDSYEEFDYAYKNPQKYNAMKLIANDYNNYKKYISGIDNVREQNKNLTTEGRKKKVISYVNKLDLTIPQKAMLIRQYYSSFKDYNKEIVNYVANSDMSYEDKIEVLKSLKFKVDDEGNVSW